MYKSWHIRCDLANGSCSIGQMKIGAKWRVKLESIIIIISSSSSSSFSVIHPIINHMRYLILLSGGTVCLSVCPSLTPYRDEPQNIMTTTAIAATETALNDQRSRRYPIEFCFSWLGARVVNSFTFSKLTPFDDLLPTGDHLVGFWRLLSHNVPPPERVSHFAMGASVPCQLAACVLSTLRKNIK